MKILELNGLKYSREQFDDYKIRCKVELYTAKEKHTLDIYTTDLNIDNIQQVLFNIKAENVGKVDIVNYTTKEQDDLTAQFIDELFNVNVHVPPFRIGKKQTRAVLDSNGKEIVIFPKGSEELAVEYANHLNKVYPNGIII